MRYSNIALAAAVILAAVPAYASDPPLYHFGRAPTQAEIDGWNIDVRADGQGLPPGRGSVAQGRAIFAQTCAACHGDKGQGGLADRLVGGIGTLTQPKPIHTVGSYWPYATTLFDFVRRAMPFNAPESLDADQVYAVSAYVLSLNGIVPDDTVLDAKSLPKVVMPNRNGFIRADSKPDVPAIPAH
ncbi:MAG: S-disulfanyl-L-cysteine oxidoreductase SoxD [Acetobacteraceae bacterium]|jgi:mono/diheme cytochrome c family protein|nr:S-disulfanyl-L-cysteine oxidoreductase SoxD [Acetobacteraceae bacterium]